jgi:outer membrane protein
MGSGVTAAADLLVGIGIYADRPELSQPAVGPLPAGVMELGGDEAPGLNLRLVPSPAFSIETFVLPPFKFALRGAGALAAAGTVGSVKVLQPTVIGHWHPLGGRTPLDPFVGAGLTWLNISHEKLNATGTALLGSPDAVRADDAFAPVLRVGGDLKLPRDFSLTLSAVYMWTDTDVVVRTPAGGAATNADLSAWIFALGVAKRFRLGRD